MPRVAVLPPLGLAMLLAACTNCSSSQTSGSTAATADRKPAARLVVLTDLEGYLEPCGCQSRPLGGIDKMAAKLEALRNEGVPTVSIAAGNLFFQPHGTVSPAGKADGQGGAAAQRPTQAIWKAKTLARILGRLEVDALAPGPADRAVEDPLLRELRRASGGAWLAARPAEAKDDEDDADAATEQPAAPGSSLAVVNAGGLSVGIWSVSRRRAGEPRTRAQLQAEARRLTAEARSRGADVVVGVTHADRRQSIRAGSAVEGLGFVIQAGLNEAPPSPPHSRGGTTFLSAGEHGQGLLVLDLFPASRAGAQGAWQDIGEWARERETKALRERIDTLSSRIETWEDDPDVRETDLQHQRDRLRSMRAELKAMQEPDAVEGDRFVSRWVELGPEAPGDPAITTLLEKHFKRVNKHNRRALADRKPEPLPEGAAGFVGSASCQDCHTEAYAWWTEHPHGRAYATLVSRDKQFNLECVGCHVTGYEQPGGSTVTHVEGLRNVGCESCHGPGSQHVSNPQQASLRRDVPKRICVDCHNAEHSDQFHYPTYRAMLLVPGHGRPLQDDSAQPTASSKDSEPSP